MIERSRRVVLLIDYDNLQICASRDTPGRDLQLAPVVQLAQHYGTVILARAYAEWNLSTERLAVYKAGIEPAFAPVLRTEGDRSGKSLADTVMVAEGMDMLWTLSPEVVVLATSDKDLIPLVRVAKQRGAFVVVLGSDFTAIPLREMADEHVTYRQLITDASGRFTTEAGPARQPAALPEPARRRPRERNGRERAAISPPATTPPATVTPAAAPLPARVEREPAAAPFSAEPVAPLSVGLSGEADSQGLGRRRRRRGSRRRSERVGLPGEGVPGSEGNDPEAEGPEELNAFDEHEEPSVSLGEFEEPSDAQFAAPAYVTEAVEVNSSNVETPAWEATPRVPQSDVEGEVAPPPPLTPAPRDRRRRTRRPAVEVAAAASTVQDAPAPTTGVAETSAAEQEEPSASLSSDGIVEVSEPASSVPATAEPDPEAAEPIAEEAAPVRRTRSRRVASASQGRSRPAAR